MMSFFLRSTIGRGRKWEVVYIIDRFRSLYSRGSLQWREKNEWHREGDDTGCVCVYNGVGEWKRRRRVVTPWVVVVSSHHPTERCCCCVWAGIKYLLLLLLCFSSSFLFFIRTNEDWDDTTIIVIATTNGWQREREKILTSFFSGMDGGGFHFI